MLRVTALLLALIAAQSAPDKLEFEVASLKPNKTGGPSGANIALGPGNVFTPTGGYLSIVNLPVAALISFAYKITGDQEQYLRAHLPEWVLTDRFNIEARAPGDATKDELRLMMQSLLADRFQAVIRHEIRQTPAYALLLTKPGKTGPQLRQHPEDSPCTRLPSADQAAARDDGFPVLCDGLLPLPHGPGQIAKFGARDVTMTFIANQLSIMGQLGCPVLDQTGLSGTFDFTLEWSPEPPNPQTAATDPLPGPTFMQALGDQMGLKLVAQTGPADFLIVDRIEHPTGN